MDRFYNVTQGVMVFIFTSCAAFMDSTFSYLIALLLGFTFNILAGFRADEVKIKLHRIFPPIVAFEKFNGNKFKDSLLELVLIASTTYLLKGLIDLNLILYIIFFYFMFYKYYVYMPKLYAKSKIKMKQRSISNKDKEAVIAKTAK